MVMVTALATCSFSPAYAQSAGCGPYVTVTKMLKEKYKESLNAIGAIKGNEAVIEFWKSSKTFTILLVNHEKGVACIKIGGSKWATAKEVKEKLPKT